MARRLAAVRRNCNTDAGPNVGMATDATEILAGATELCTHVKFSSRRKDHSKVSSLGEKRALMEQYLG